MPRDSLWMILGVEFNRRISILTPWIIGERNPILNLVWLAIWNRLCLLTTPAGCVGLLTLPVTGSMRVQILE